MDVGSAESLLALAEELSLRVTGPDAKSSVDALEARSHDLTTAIAWFLDAGRPNDALRLANALYRFWITTRRFDEGARWFDRVLEPGAGDEGLRGRAYLSAGFMPFWLGDDERAASLFEQALTIARHRGDASSISQALGGLARVALRTDVAEGRRLAREAFEVSDAEGDDQGRSNALHLLGVGAQIAGDLLEARDWMRRRLALVRAMGNEFLVASEASNLSMVERQLGDLDAAEGLAREAIQISASGSATASRRRLRSAVSRQSDSSEASTSVPRRWLAPSRLSWTRPRWPGRLTSARTTSGCSSPCPSRWAPRRSNEAAVLVDP
ncbi:MAG: hypothetical protein H0V73_00850 [Chloroflexi bacterium]|nr:hypothetical protein [Chloroflexota bacterium]